MKQPAFIKKGAQLRIEKTSALLNGVWTIDAIHAGQGICTDEKRLVLHLSRPDRDIPVAVTYDSEIMKPVASAAFRKSANKSTKLQSATARKRQGPKL